MQPDEDDGLAPHGSAELLGAYWLMEDSVSSRHSGCAWCRPGRFAEAQWAVADDGQVGRNGPTFLSRRELSLPDVCLTWFTKARALIVVVAFSAVVAGIWAVLAKVAA